MDAKTLIEDRTSSLDDYYRMMSDTVNRDENLTIDGNNEERDAYETQYQSKEIKVSYPECKEVTTKKESLQKSKIYGEVSWSTLPVHSSIFYGAPLKVIQNLLSSNPNALKTKDDRGEIPLHLAFRKGDEDLIIEFLKDYPEGFYVKNSKGNIPFQCIAPNHKFSETLSELLESYDHLNCIHREEKEEERDMEKRIEFNDESSLREDKKSETPVREDEIENLSNKQQQSQNADYDRALKMALKKIQYLEGQNSELPGLKSTVTALKEQIVILERRNNNLGKIALEKLASSEERNKFLVEFLAKSEKEKKANHKAYVIEVDGLKAMLKDSENKLEKKLEIISTLKEENKVIPELEKKIQDVTEVLHGKSKQNSELKDKVKDLEEKINRLPSEDEIEGLLEAKKNIDKKLIDATEEINVKNKENSEMKEKMTNLEEMINRLPSEAETDALREKIEQMVPKLVEHIKELEKEIASKNDDCGISSERIKNLEKMVTDSDRKLSDSLVKIAALEEENKMIPRLMTEMNHSVEQLVVKNNENSEIKEKAKNLEDELSRLKEIEEKVKNLQESHEKSAERVRVLEEENTKIPQLEKTIEDASRKLAASSDKCSALEGLLEENEQIKSSIEKAMQIMTILEQENESVVAKIDDNIITEENRVLKENIDLLKDKMSKKVNDLFAILCQNLGVKETTISTVSTA